MDRGPVDHEARRAVRALLKGLLDRVAHMRRVGLIGDMGARVESSDLEGGHLAQELLDFGLHCLAAGSEIGHRRALADALEPPPRPLAPTLPPPPGWDNPDEITPLADSDLYPVDVSSADTSPGTPRALAREPRASRAPTRPVTDPGALGRPGRTLSGLPRTVPPPLPRKPK